MLSEPQGRARASAERNRRKTSGCSAVRPRCLIEHRAIDPHVGILKGFLLRMTIHRCPQVFSWMTHISVMLSEPQGRARASAERNRRKTSGCSAVRPRCLIEHRAIDPHVGILKGFLLRMTIHRPPAASEMDDISCFASTPPLYAVQASDLPKQYSLLRAEFPTDFDARRGFGKTESTKRKGRNPARMDTGGGKNHLFFEKNEFYYFLIRKTILSLHSISPNMRNRLTQGSLRQMGIENPAPMFGGSEYYSYLCSPKRFMPM